MSFLRYWAETDVCFVNNSCRYLKRNYSYVIIFQMNLFYMYKHNTGVFLSVDYPLVDHHRCRGYYYRSQMGDIVWSWKVHLVWTLAFVVSIWLATVAAFFLESSIPVPKVISATFHNFFL